LAVAPTRRRKITVPTMRAVPKTLQQRGLSWLFWLALLLPLTQCAASWHGYSHLRGDTVVQEDGKRSAAHSCELCLIGAAVIGGILPSRAQLLGLLGLNHAAPLPGPFGSWLAVTTTVYLSRAPPASR
jgi:hypothetical protein